MTVYAGLYKMSCDMCDNLTKPKRTIMDKGKSSVKMDICDICYGKCLAHPKFNEGIKSGYITATDYKGG